MAAAAHAVDYFALANHSLGAVKPLSVRLVPSAGSTELNWERFSLRVVDDLLEWTRPTTYKEIVALRESLLSRAPDLPKIPRHRMSSTSKVLAGLSEFMVSAASLCRDGLPGSTTVGPFLSLAGGEWDSVGAAPAFRIKRSNELAAKSAEEALNRAMAPGTAAAMTHAVRVAVASNSFGVERSYGWVNDSTWMATLAQSRERSEERERVEDGAKQELERLWQIHAWHDYELGYEERTPVDSSSHERPAGADTAKLRKLVKERAPRLNPGVFQHFQSAVEAHEAAERQADTLLDDVKGDVGIERLDTLLGELQTKRLRASDAAVELSRQAALQRDREIERAQTILREQLETAIPTNDVQAMTAAISFAEAEGYVPKSEIEEWRREIERKQQEQHRARERARQDREHSLKALAQLFGGSPAGFPCTACGQVKVSTEFPAQPLSSQCGHAPRQCWRCSWVHCADSWTCPECCVPIDAFVTGQELKQSMQSALYSAAQQNVKPETEQEICSKDIRVATLDGTSYTVQCSPNMTTSAFKIAVEAATNVKRTHQRLLYQGRELTEFVQGQSGQALVSAFGVAGGQAEPVNLIVKMYEIERGIESLLFRLEWQYPVGVTGQDRFLDGTCALFDSGTKTLPMEIDYHKNKAPGVQHEQRIDESSRKITHEISLQLKNLPSKITRGFFILSAFKGGDIGIYQPRVQLLEYSGPTPRNLCESFDASKIAAGAPAVIMCVISRPSAGSTQWVVEQIGAQCHGNTGDYSDIRKACRRLIENM
jgi:hypothetical protein